MVLGFGGLRLDTNVLAEDGGLLLPLAVHLNFLLRTSRGDHSETFLLSEIFSETRTPAVGLTWA